MIINPYNAKKEATTLNLQGLLAYYTFNGDATDSYGPYNATENNSPSYGDGKIGNALICVPHATTPEYVAIPDADVFSFTDGAGQDQAFSISAWVYTANASEEGWIVNKRAPSTQNEYNFILYENNLYLTVFTGGATSNFIGTGYTPYTVPVNTWTHIAGTYDGSETAAGLKVYVNGLHYPSAEVITGTHTGISNTGSTTVIGVAGDVPVSVPRGWDGKIDLVQIWRRELSYDEIALIYNTENAGTLITA